MQLVPRILFLYLISLSFAYGGTHITYINGASVDDDGARTQQAVFLKSMTEYGVSGNIKYIPRTIGQPTNESRSITLCQGAIVNDALPTAGAIPSSYEYLYYFEKLGKVYTDRSNSCLKSSQYIYADNLYFRTIGLFNQLKDSIQSGNNVIIVSYSQGNLYAEAAIGLLLYNKIVSNFDKIKVINIGNVSPTSLNGVNVTSTLDSIVDIFLAFPKIYTPCINSCTASASSEDILSVGGDSKGHYFSSTYFNKNLKTIQTKNNFISVIAGALKTAIEELEPVQYSISPTTAEISKDITFTITGKNLTSGMGFAVDDCTPSNNELPGGTSTQRQFRCTINSIPGDKNIYLKDKPGGKVLFTTKITATANSSAKWLSTITPPDYVVKQFIYKDLNSTPNGNFTATGEYRINKDSIGCNLTQSLSVTGTRSNNNFNIRLEYNSDYSSCYDGTHTANKGYVETYTGVLNSGVIFVTPQSACSFSIGSTCYNFASFSPVQ